MSSHLRPTRDSVTTIGKEDGVPARSEIEQSNLRRLRACAFDRKQDEASAGQRRGVQVRQLAGP